MLALLRPFLWWLLCALWSGSTLADRIGLEIHAHTRRKKPEYSEDTSSVLGASLLPAEGRPVNYRKWSRESCLVLF